MVTIEALGVRLMGSLRGGGNTEVRRQDTDDRNQIKIYLKDTPPGQEGWNRRGERSEPTSVPGWSISF